MTMRQNLKLGDMLYRSKGIVEHKGVYLGADKVLHNSPEGDVSIVDFDDFAKGEQVKIIQIDEHNVHLLSQRLHEVLARDERYVFWSNNCEDIANFLVFGRKYSPQMQAACIGGLIGAAVGVKTKKEHWWALALVGGVGGLLLCNLTRKYDAVIQAA
jgi:hypothetical protein